MLTAVKIFLVVALGVTVFYVVAPARGRAWLEERYELVSPAVACIWRVLCGAARGAHEAFNRERGD